MTYAKTIIIIEDDKDIANLLHYNIQRIGVKLLLAYDGEEGLRLIRENMADLIILDLMLPKRDGFDILSIIKEDAVYCDVPVLILSAKINPGAIIRGFRMGAVDYIPKPFNVGELLLKVKEVLKIKSSAGTDKTFV